MGFVPVYPRVNFQTPCAVGRITYAPFSVDTGLNALCRLRLCMNTLANLHVTG